jgi:hypothetical protein
MYEPMHNEIFAADLGNACHCTTKEQAVDGEIRIGIDAEWNVTF